MMNKITVTHNGRRRAETLLRDHVYNFIKICFGIGLTRILLRSYIVSLIFFSFLIASRRYCSI